MPLQAPGDNPVWSPLVGDINLGADLRVIQVADLEADDIYAALAYAARLTQTNHVELLAA